MWCFGRLILSLGLVIVYGVNAAQEAMLKGTHRTSSLHPGLHMLTNTRRRVEERPPQPSREAQPLREELDIRRNRARLLPCHIDRGLGLVPGQAVS